MRRASSLVVEAEGVCKAFGSVEALRAVDWSLREGEIHALLGENGAGKSTLIRILAGDHAPDAGRIAVDGREARFGHPSEALARGIACVHQIPAFVAGLSVTENLRLGLDVERGRLGLIDWDAEHARAARALAEVRLDVDPRTPLGELGAHARQLVALCRALATGPQVLILDEITAPLSEPEVQLLHDVVRGLRARDVAVVYVSHRLEEVMQIADRVTVLRDGRRVATAPIDGLTREDLAELIVGRPVGELFGRRGAGAAAPDASAPLVTVDGVGELEPGASFDVRAGEILGLAGLAGSGRSRLLGYLFGVHRPALGAMTIGGTPWAPDHPAQAIAAGVGLVTEDRLVDGFVERLSVGHNITLPWVSRFKRRGILRLRAERAAADELARRLRVQTPSIGASMQTLSGGNQQKAILARWTSADLRLLLLDEPTHGVDVGAKGEIYDLIRAHASSGVAIVVASSELEELEALCDRVVLVSDGATVGELGGEELTKDEILHELLASRPEAVPV
jgi:ABC-type sugar transport system ATPase subunit